MCPILDRIDLHIEVGSVKYSQLESTKKEENSGDIRERVKRTRQIQIERYKEFRIFSNSELTTSLVKKFCAIDEDANKLLKSVFEKLGLSARAHNRILKVARTIADMEQSENILKVHIAEAIQYRSLDRNYFAR